MGPHSLSIQLAPAAGSSVGSSSSALALRPLSRVTLSLRKDPALRFDMGAKFSTRVPPQQQSRASRARESPYLRHLPHRKRETYLHSIGTLKELEVEDDTQRLENNLRAQLSKIISPIKAPSSVWRKGGGSCTDESPGQQQLRNQLAGANHASQHQGFDPFFSLGDEHFSVSPTSSFSGEEELWSGAANHFPPTMNQTVVATPLSDISDFDREITPGQFSTASASSGIYGDFEEEVVAGSSSDDYEFIPF